MYELRYLKPAERYFRRIWEPRQARAFQDALQAIAADPYAGDRKKGDLAGVFCYGFFHEKVYYEIAYRIHEENGQSIVVVLSGTRENFYVEVKQYMQ
jgi:plasmid stabilization system protein ParE